MKPSLALLAVFALAGCGTAYLEGLPRKGEPAEAKGKVSDSSEKEKSDEKRKESAAGEKDKEEPKDKEEGKEKEEPKGHVTVRCVPAQKRAVAITVDGLGRTEPLPDSVGALTATVEGHVHKLLAKLGDSVKAGQPIVELDTTVAKTALAEKVANRDSLKAALTLLTAPPRPADLRAAELAVEQAKVAVARDSHHVENLRPLVARKEAPATELFDAEQALKQARLQQATAEAQLTLLKIGPRREAIDEAQTKIRIADEAVANARALLDLHMLRAPIGGIVDSLNCHPGQTLTVGTAVGEIVDRRRVFVTVYLPTRSARHVQPGLPVRIELADGDNREPSTSKAEDISGQVAFVGAVADPQTGNFPARVLVDNKGGRLRIGQVVKADVKLGTEAAAIVVPEAAVFDQGEGPLLAVVREGKIALLHPQLGTVEEGLVVVTKTDLKEGEMVVTEGAYSVPEGTIATIEPGPAKEPGKVAETEKEPEPAKGSKPPEASKPPEPGPAHSSAPAKKE